MIKDSGTHMVGQYFRRRRDWIEMLEVASQGFGISFMTAAVDKNIRSVCVCVHSVRVSYGS